MRLGYAPTLYNLQSTSVTQTVETEHVVHAVILRLHTLALAHAFSLICMHGE